MNGTINSSLIFSLRHPRVRFFLLGAAISMLFCLLVGAGYWLPTLRAYSQIQSEISVYRRNTSDIEYQSRLADISEKAAIEVDRIERKVDVAVTQAALVQNMALLARKSNVKIVSESYEEGRPLGEYAPLIQLLMVQAGYGELREFIAGVHRLPSFTLVQEAVITKSANSTVLKAQLRIITYRRDKDPRKI